MTRRSCVLVSIAGLAQLPIACGASSSDGVPAVDSGSDTASAAVGSDSAADAPAPKTACDLAGAPKIETVGMLTAGRYSPGVARLDDDRVLIAGGFDFTRGMQKTTELFDPLANALSAGPSLKRGRNFPAVVRRPGIDVLVVGGFSASLGSLADAESFDVGATLSSVVSGTMSVGREAHTATLLPDGRVLVAGGLQASGFKFHLTTELFDPATGAFAPGTSMSAARAFHVALLTSDRVVMVGGDSGKGELASAEAWSLDDGTFSSIAGGLVHAAKALAAAPLPGNRFLVAGGANATDGTLADAAIFDAGASGGGAFSPTASMATRRIAFTLTALADGRVLAVGGFTDSSTPRASTAVLEVFDPITGAWETLPITLAQKRHDHVAVLLADCRVLVVGGQQVVDGTDALAPREVEVLTIPTRAR